MKSKLSLIAVAASVFLAVAAPSASAQDGDKVAKVLEKWIKQYRKGKYDVGDWFVDISDKSLGRKAKLIDPKKFGDRGVLGEGEFSYRDEIWELTEIAAKTNSRKCAEILLQFAAIGLDDEYEYTSSMSPYWMRWLGERAIGQFNSTSAIDYFVEAAQGKPVGPKEIHSALQAEAIKVLSLFEEEEYTQVMLGGLESEDPLVRAQAADGVRFVGTPEAVPLIVSAFEKEESEIAWVAYVQALEYIYFKNEGQVDDRAFMAGLQRAADCLGKGSWQADVALIEVLEKFPIKETVPKLIDIIVKFDEHPELVEAGTLTGLQRRAAYEAVQKLTGAFYAMDDSAKWKALWERVGDNFEIVDMQKTRDQLMAEWKEEEAERQAAQQEVGGSTEIKTAGGKKKQTAGTVTNDFFGIPIYGSRVVFVLDVSGSMSLPMQIADPANAKEEWLRDGTDRLEVAKEEVRKTIEKLTDDVYFNIVTYSDDVKLWQAKGLVQASKKNKDAAYKYLRKLGPGGNTNIYDAFATSVDLSKLLYGERYGANVDEMFLLSDGVPNRGAVKFGFDIMVSITDSNRFSRVRINTVFTGMPNDPADPGERGMNLMKDIAERNGGSFIRP